MSAVAKSPGSLAIAARTEHSMTVLTLEGVLNTSNSTALRNCIMKATIDQPSAIIVDVTGLQAAAESAWSAFISVRWEVGTQPDVPIVLVCGHRAAREAIARSGVGRFMPVYPTEKSAMTGINRLARRTLRRIDAQLPANLTSLRESRRLVREWLTAWSQTALIPVALVVVNVFVENVLEHTGSDPLMQIESDGATATIAVSDGSAAPARRLASPLTGIDVSGLAIVAALSRAWGSTPTSSGKTVWAVIGPESQL
ncbi:sulfate transporter [Mycobacterium haemophilum DSM 44634]|uniref:STAS domain-containing protein n=1 Tax=Mycobacterium haemophilum TaxID=29311 RepID=UPI0006563634|nr:STAS domain-containing protein [Mycobacterium haemophilum]AKN16246.1 sulfate transporter [Mycobacterium haemophilum DSM 44634]MCV7339771.1 STAS domain-containing protein [Mycobacterium haemophilum DSM 44634]